VILYGEAVRFVAIAIQELHNPLQLYLSIGAIFILINYGLSKLAVWTERRLTHRGQRGPMVQERAGAIPGEPVFAGPSSAGG
jgi:glutamate transport system permease protein